jgi:hypothetical protein
MFYFPEYSFVADTSVPFKSYQLTLYTLTSVAYRGGVWGDSTHSTPKHQSFDKAKPNSQFDGKYTVTT